MLTTIILSTGHIVAIRTEKPIGFSNNGWSDDLTAIYIADAKGNKIERTVKNFTYRRDQVIACWIEE